MVLLDWPPPHFNPTLTTGKLPSKVIPCLGEVPPTLELVLSSLEHILPQAGGWTPQLQWCCVHAESVHAALEYPVPLENMAALGVCLECVVSTSPCWQLQPLPQADLD